MARGAPNCSTLYWWGSKGSGNFPEAAVGYPIPGNVPAPIEPTSHTDGIFHLGSFRAPLLSSWHCAPTAPVAHHTSKKKKRKKLSCYWLLISYPLILLTGSLFLQKEKEVCDLPSPERSIIHAASSRCLLVVIFSKANSHLSFHSLKRRVFFLCS